MSVFDRFLNAMKLNDDDDLDNETGYLDDDYDDDFEEERPAKKRLIGRYDDDEDEEEMKPAPAKSIAAPAAERPAPKARPKVVRNNNSSSSKISPMRPRSNTGMELCVIKPRSMEDTHEITETLQDGCTVILNMEGIDLALAQRIVDFTCGSIYALHGKFQRVNGNIFLVTPQNVEISGEFQEVLDGSIGAQSFESRF